MNGNNDDNIETIECLNEYLSTHNNSEPFSYFSKVPDDCKTYPCVLGIDEAGRGPVLGPMVYGTAFCCINSMQILANLECDDSKALTEEKRVEILSNLLKQRNKVGWGVEVISPTFICNSMLSRSKYSLNRVSMDSAVGLIRKAVENGVNINAVYVDTVGPPEKYQAYLESLFPNFKITVAKKADSTYPIVSAASICAKVTRDQALKVWKFSEDLAEAASSFGSGYPGDPVTKKFLFDFCDPIFGFPQLVRFSWSTASTALEESAYHVEWEAIEEDEKQSKKSRTLMTSFFNMTKSETDSNVQKHNFFKRRNLSSTLEL
ncbi:ribonuclease H2 subunit A-like [Agrilus planipennis]|uniref:Ribonuclease n=1 Tax=Agrilus planipennis TaxID=224129 RepID=A0A1W4WJ11_AGRPL|nr:ribonuclease H2 subunit A [Agrilus planipennis]XP_025829324.1 ribonuclease H2 subunit A-like [Agrilus planipennis]